MSIFKVIAHTGINNNGYIQYDTDTKELDICLHDPEKEAQVREYLTKEQTLRRYIGLSTFETLSAAPVSSLENLKLALGYIWVALGVHIDWSRPTDAV